MKCTMKERGNTSWPGVQQPKIPKVSRKEWWVIGLTGFFIGLFMLVYDTRIAFGKLIMLRGFWTSLASSVACTWVIMTVVIFVTRWLDGTVPWRPKFHRRLTLQVLLGVLIPAMLALAWTLIFLACLDCLPRIEHYLYLDFPLAVLLIVGFNACCTTILVPLGTPPTTAVTHAPERDTTPDIPEDEAAELGSTVAFFVSENKQTIVYQLDGTVSVDLRKVKEIARALAGNTFFCIRHGVVVNRAAIDAVHPERRHCRIVLKPPYSERIFYTSKSRSHSFSMWWRQGKG